MTDLLVKMFVKDHENVEDSRVRENYGTLSSITGIVCNIFLFVLKYFIGTLTGSISIISDAFNNLSDSANCIVTLFGYKLAAKPADKDHPFGHGRMEYLTSLIIAVMIMLVGFELLKGSVEKLFAPAELVFSVGAVCSLILSIGVKLWMSAFNSKLGKRINSSVMLATAQDSRSDVIATSAALVGLVSSLVTSLPVDAVMGIVVSVFILKTGFEIIKDTVDELLGKPADSELVERISGLVTENERIIGIHDLVVHSYGPGKSFASCHAEVRSTENIVEIHEMIDACERNIFEKTGIVMTIHMDPIDVDNEQANLFREMVRAAVRDIDGRMSIHDFRITSGERCVNLIFDVVVPYDVKMSDEQIKAEIDGKIVGGETVCFTVITFDREYVDRVR